MLAHEWPKILRVVSDFYTYQLVDVFEIYNTCKTHIT